MSVITTTFGGKLIWSWVSQFEVAEGLLAVALLLSSVILIEALGLSSRLDSRIFRFHLKPRLSYVFTLVAAGGTVSYALLVLCNMEQLRNVIDINGWNVVQYPLDLLGAVGGGAMASNGRDGYGALALLMWIATLLSVTLSAGLSKAVRYFAMPSIIFLTCVVLLFDPGEMDSQAINIVSGITFNNVSLMSNWFLFTASLSLAIFEVIRSRLESKLSALHQRRPR
jgi:hypothetical protein